MYEFTVDYSLRHWWWRNQGAAQYWPVAHQCLLGFALALACQSALAQAMYRIKPIGSPGECTSYASGLNGTDDVAVTACNAHGDTHAFLWKNNGTPMVDLGPNDVGSTSAAWGINASGLVVGNGKDSTGMFAFVSSGDGTPMRRTYANGGASSIEALALNDLGQVTGDAWTKGDLVVHAFMWNSNGSVRRDLGTLSVGNDSAASAINASGQVAGVAYFLSGETYHAFIWKNDGTPMLDLGTFPGGTKSGACCINASGQVAGTSNVNPFLKKHAFLWRNDGTPMQDLGTLQGGTRSVASALNDSGQVAGFSDLHRGGSHVFVWLNDGTPMKDLGTLGGTQSFPNDLNASGQLTGWAFLAGDTVNHAFLWRNDGTKIQDLNKLIDSADPLKPYITLTNGDFINDFGDIVADGTDSRTGTDGLYLLQGTVLTLAPRSLAFGNQPIRSTSAAKLVTVTNTSAKVVTVANIALTGSGAGQFGSTNNCGSSLVGHAVCTIKVTFKPTTKGAKSAALEVNGGGGGLRSVSLTGNGT